MTKIVIVSPHLDDAVVMCGGTINVFKKYVTVINLDTKLSSESMKTDIEALTFLGVKRNCINYYTKLEELEEVLKQISPTILILPHEKDLFPEHSFVARHCSLLNLNVKSVFQTGCPNTVQLRNDVFVELEEKNVLEKEKAIEFYDWFKEKPPNEDFDIIHNRKWVKFQAQRLGASLGVNYAETFDLCKAFKLEDFL